MALCLIFLEIAMGEVGCWLGEGQSIYEMAGWVAIATEEMTFRI